MKQAAVVKNIRIVQMPIINCLNAMPSNTNLSSPAFVPIDEQMQKREMNADPTDEMALDKILKDYDQAWKALANV